MTHLTMALRSHHAEEGREEEEEEEEEEEGVCWPMGKPCPPGTASLAGGHWEIREEEVAQYARGGVFKDLS